MVAYGVEVSGVEKRNGGAPGLRWNPQSSDAQAEVALLEVVCADVAQGLVSV